MSKRAFWMFSMSKLQKLLKVECRFDTSFLVYNLIFASNYVCKGVPYVKYESIFNRENSNSFTYLSSPSRLCLFGFMV